MAQRYLRATGNWNGPVWAATSGGAAGSAATPVAGDDVYIAANYTVTLTADAACSRLDHSNGTLNLGSYTLFISGYDKGGGDYQAAAFESYGSTARTINCGSGKIHLQNTVRQWSGSGERFYLDGSNLTFIAGTSLIQIDCAGDMVIFGTLSKTFNDVVINIGVQGTFSNEVGVFGSPTFRSLIIQSKNSAAHTVKFSTDFGNTECAKFVCIGSSPTNRITLADSDMSSHNFTIVDSFYAQNIDAQVYMPDSGSRVVGQRYAGTGSLNSNGQLTLQDPPKISTLVDPLTTAPGSNSNWTVTGTVTQVTSGKDGGGYKLSSGASLVSADTYDLVDSELVFESASQTIIGNAKVDSLLIDARVRLSTYFMNDQFATMYAGTNNASGYLYGNPPDYYRYRISGSTLTVDASTDGVTWQYPSTYMLSADELSYFRSTRVVFDTVGSDSLGFAIGSINPILAPASTGNFLPFFTP